MDGLISKHKNLLAGFNTSVKLRAIRRGEAIFSETILNAAETR